MRKFDTRWISVPILVVLALTIGGANPWVVALVFLGVFPIRFKW
jgi:hypothetical protein